MVKELVFTHTFKKNYKRLPLRIQNTFDKKLELFLQNPQHPSLNIHKYKSKQGIWKVYVTKQYRFTFSVTKENIIFRNIGAHSIDKGNVIK